MRSKSRTSKNEMETILDISPGFTKSEYCNDKVKLSCSASKEGNMRFLHNFFRCLEDQSIIEFVQLHSWQILFCAVVSASIWLMVANWLWMRGFRRFDPFNGIPFCQYYPMACIRNRIIQSIMLDYRRTRDSQLDPSGTHARFDAGYNKLDSCHGPLLLHYTDSRLFSWWGHLLPAQSEGLSECNTPCMVTGNISEADILIGMLQPPAEAQWKEWWQRIAVVNLEAHSINRDSMARTDLFVSYHSRSDVIVNYFYALSHGVPCFNIYNCLFDAVNEDVKMFSVTPRSRTAKVVMFISAKCDRFERYLQTLLSKIKRDLQVDSFGRCHNNMREADDPLFEPSRPVISKDRITSQYKFQIVIENEIVDDYVSEKFFEGFKSSALMVYLGAPNAAKFAPAPHSYVDALRFAGPGELGEYLLRLDRNQSLYDSYLAWRTAPALRPEFAALAAADFGRTDAGSWQCRLCAAYAQRFCRGGVQA